MSQPTWAQIEAAIQSAIATASGLTTVWAYQNANAPGPAYIRLSLGVVLTTGIDYVVESKVPDWQAAHGYDVGDVVLHDSEKLYECTAPGTSAGSGGPIGTGSAITDGGVTWKYVRADGQVQLTLGGTREVALQFECFTAASDNSTDPALGLVEAKGETARSVLDRVNGRLRMPTARDALGAVGFVPFDPGPVNWVPDVPSISFRGRASCDVRCRMPARALAEYVAAIRTIRGEIDVTGTPGGGVIIETFAETIESP